MSSEDFRRLAGFDNTQYRGHEVRPRSLIERIHEARNRSRELLLERRGGYSECRPPELPAAAEMDNFDPGAIWFSDEGRYEVVWVTTGRHGRTIFASDQKKTAASFFSKWRGAPFGHMIGLRDTETHLWIDKPPIFRWNLSE